MKRKSVFILYLLMMSFGVFSQSNDALTNPEKITQHLLDLVSIEAGEKMPVEEIKSLFIENARLSILNQGDSSFVESVSIDEFAELLNDPYYENGFQERPLGTISEEFNGIAQVFQSFEAVDSEGESGRGINSFQLAYFNERWWIVSLVWTTTDGIDIPEKYLNGK